MPKTHRPQWTEAQQGLPTTEAEFEIVTPVRPGKARWLAYTPLQKAAYYATYTVIFAACALFAFLAPVIGHWARAVLAQ